jgi:prephenate dehydrogenase
MSDEPRALQDATVAIIGLGLMGGSVGHALAGKCAVRLGADREPQRAQRAVTAGAIDEALDAGACAARADLVVLAMPVRQVIELAPRLAGRMRTGAVITDLGSTKVEVCTTFDHLAYEVGAVGSHPMCGREQGGLDAASAELFTGATWVLVPTTRTTDAAARLVTELAVAVGAIPRDLDRDVHDRAVATASHAPYVVAQSLVAALADADDATDGIASELAATGFQGATRLAGGDVEMWLDILATNSENVRNAIADVRARLDRLDTALDDPTQLEALLVDGRRARRALTPES